MTESSDYKSGIHEECLESAALDHSTDSLSDHCWAIFHMAQQGLQGQNVSELEKILVGNLYP